MTYKIVFVTGGEQTIQCDTMNISDNGIVIFEANGDIVLAVSLFSTKFIQKI